MGQVEYIAHLGAISTDFNLIRPGALHRANGGYLILDAYKLLLQPYAWEALKRSLRSSQIRIESLGQMLSLVSTVSLGAAADSPQREGGSGGRAGALLPALLRSIPSSMSCSRSRPISRRTWTAAPKRMSCTRD